MGNPAKALTGSTDTGMLNTLMALDSLSHDPIRMVITSMGGDLNIVFLLYDVIKLIKSPVEMLGRICVSGAALLLAAGSKRYLSPHAKVMLHLPSGMIEGDIHEWEIQHTEMQKYKEKMVDMLQECGVKADRDTILRDVDRDFWLEPEEAISYGLADTVMTPEMWGQWIKKEDK
jgi:ATP-dependent Clp protease protease subunit